MEIIKAEEEKEKRLEKQNKAKHNKNKVNRT